MLELFPYFLVLSCSHVRCFQPSRSTQRLLAFPPTPKWNSLGVLPWVSKTRISEYVDYCVPCYDTFSLQSLFKRWIGMELLLGLFIIIIIVSMGFFAFTPPSQLYCKTIKSLPQTTYYRVLCTRHNPFFVGALVATSIHTAVMYDAPWHWSV